MTERAFEKYDDHYLRTTAFRDSKILTPEELARDRAPRWLNRLPKDAHILDYGCADGYMLWVLHSLGYHNLMGADISDSVLRHARERLAGTAIELRLLESAPLDDCAGRFDAIIMHHVLEHIPRESVIPTLEFLFSLLKPGAFMSVAVPNAAALTGGFSHAIDFTHQVSFTEYSLRQALELAGFDGVELVLHPPRLFFSPRRPLGTLKRFLGRIQYQLNNLSHFAFYLLRDQRPFPQCFECSVELLAFHRTR